MPTLTAEALEFFPDRGNGRVHLVRPGTMRPLGDGLYEAITLCGERIVGRPARGAAGYPICECCQAAS